MSSLEDLVLEYQRTNDEILYEKIHGRLQPMIEHLSSGRIKGFDRDDVRQECAFSGFKGVKRYVPTAKCKIETYLYTCMLNRVRNLCRQRSVQTVRFDPKRMSAVEKREDTKPADLKFMEPLNDREHEVLELMATGLSRADVAATLGVKYEHVEWAIVSIKKKLQLPQATHKSSVRQRLARWRDKVLPHAIGREPEVLDLFLLGHSKKKAAALLGIPYMAAHVAICRLDRRAKAIAKGDKMDHWRWGRPKQNGHKAGIMTPDGLPPT